MANPFLGPWTIAEWSRGPAVSEGIPDNGFNETGPLNITQLDQNSIELVWLNGADQPCFVTGLNFDEVNNLLVGQGLMVNFAGRIVQCDFTVNLESGTSVPTLTLSINITPLSVSSSTKSRTAKRSSPESDRPDVGSGVVTATATGQ